MAMFSPAPIGRQPLTRTSVISTWTHCWKAYLEGRAPGQSAVSGEIRLQGALRQPRDLHITGNLSDLSTGIEGVKLRNDGPVRLAMSRGALTIDQLHLIGDNTDLSAGGSVQLTGERDLDFHVQGKANLQLIQTFNRDFISSGMVTVDATVSGTTSKPTIQGRVQFTNGSLAYSDLPSALNDINGSLAFNQNRLEIETLTAHTGGGLVTFSGQASAYNHQLNFDLAVKGEGVRLRYPPGVSSTANEDLHSWEVLLHPLFPARSPLTNSPSLRALTSERISSAAPRRPTFRRRILC